MRFRCVDIFIEVSHIFDKRERYWYVWSEHKQRKAKTAETKEQIFAHAKQIESGKFDAFNWISVSQQKVKQGFD